MLFLKKDDPSDIHQRFQMKKADTPKPQLQSIEPQVVPTTIKDKQTDSIGKTKPATLHQSINDIFRRLEEYELLAKQQLEQKKSNFKYRLQNKLFDSSKPVAHKTDSHTANTTGLEQENIQKVENKIAEFSDKKMILSLCAFVGIKYVIMLAALAIYSP